MKIKTLLLTSFMILLFQSEINKTSEAKDNISTIYPTKKPADLEKLFNQYSCKVTSNKMMVSLDTKSFAKFSNFRGKIMDGIKQEVNFGGKYILITWGCGSGCQSGVVVDSKTGIISSLPTSEFGIEHKKDSLLFVVNPPSSESRPPYGYPAYYIFENNNFKLLHDTRK